MVSETDKFSQIKSTNFSVSVTTITCNISRRRKKKITQDIFILIRLIEQMSSSESIN